MIRLLIATAAALLTVPLEATTPLYPHRGIHEGLRAFFDALGSEDRTALARQMLPDGMIFIHDRMDPENRRVVSVPVSQHLERWATGSGEVREKMFPRVIVKDGDMAQVWGPYAFWVDAEISHCGINSLSMVLTDEGWKVANTSFSMEPPSECERLGVPEPFLQ